MEHLPHARIKKFVDLIVLVCAGDSTLFVSPGAFCCCSVMSEGPASTGRWGKKRKGLARAQIMREAKKLKREGDSMERLDCEPVQHPAEEPAQVAEHDEPTQLAEHEDPASVTMKEGEQHAPSTSYSVHEDRELEDDPDGDTEEEEEYNSPQEAFDDFVLTLTRDQRKMLSVLLYESFRGRQKMSKMDAAQESASITGLYVLFNTTIFIYLFINLFIYY